MNQSLEDEVSGDLVKNVSGSIIFTVVEVEKRIDQIAQIYLIIL